MQDTQRIELLFLSDAAWVHEQQQAVKNTQVLKVKTQIKYCYKDVALVALIQKQFWKEKVLFQTGKDKLPFHWKTSDGTDGFPKM